MIDCAAISITPFGFEITVYSTDGNSFRGSYLRGRDDYTLISGQFAELEAFCKDKSLALALCNMVHPTGELAEAIRKQQ